MPEAAPNYEALCVEILGHPRLTAGDRTKIVSATLSALKLIAASPSSSTSTRANAEGLANQEFQINSFCNAARLIEDAAVEDPAILPARNTYRATLTVILKKILNVSAGAKTRTNWGLVLGVSGAAILTATMIYVLATRDRNRVPRLAPVR
jgi:hypothetical protein